jgi:hypothetical protein
VIDVSGVDFSPVTKKVPEFDFYRTRLQDVDYKKIIAKRDDWKDPNFPPSQASLIDPEMFDNEPEKYNSWRNFTWRRPQDKWGDGGFVLYDKIEVNDIKQGLLGDCYFLSCLSALAEDPARIKRIFITQEVNEAGIYAV